MRHAKSSWDDSTLEDFERPLNDRGRAAAEKVGRELKRRGLRFDHVLASPALRVRQTLERLSAGFGGRVEPRFDPDLYGADQSSWLAAIQDLPETVHAPLIVGHNPALHRLVIDLTLDDPAGRRDSLQDKFPTAALAVIALDVSSWPDVNRGCGEIVELILPRELD